MNIQTKIIPALLLAICVSGSCLGGGEEQGGGEYRFYDLCRQNLELAREGRLAEDAFTLVQYTTSGLVLEWEQDWRLAELLSDIYYEAGHMALAQRYAFEASVFAKGDYNPQMLRRLIQTNIIYGAYPVAEKYIAALEGDRKYGKWAAAQRLFLGNDEAVAADPEYGAKRKCIPEEDFLSSATGIEDLEHVIDANPEHHNSIEYLGVYYLLACDFDSFTALLEKYYGTAALPRLPRSFAEAVCLMSEINYGYLRKYGVDGAIYKRYCAFADRLGAGLGLSMEKYSDTYWYYVMKMNSQEQ